VTDFDEIWSADAFCPTEPYGPETKIRIEKSRKMKIVIYPIKFPENVE